MKTNAERKYCVRVAVMVAVLDKVARGQGRARESGGYLEKVLKEEGTIRTKA